MNGFLERLAILDDGSLVVSGWARAERVEIALSETDSPETPFLLLVADCDLAREDIPQFANPGFSVSLAPALLRLLPHDTRVAASAGGLPLPPLNGCEPRIAGGSPDTGDLACQLAAGMRWSRKTGDLYLPISNWEPGRAARSLDLLADICRASEQRLTPCYGTLLGIIRHGTLIPHDDDLDAAAYIAAESVSDLVSQWVQIVSETARAVGARCRFADDLFHVLLHREEGASIDCWPVWLRRDGSFVDVHAAGSASDFSLMPTTVEGRRVWIPRHSAALLEHCYGPTYLLPSTSWRPEHSYSDDPRVAAARDFRSAVNRAMTSQVTLC